MWDSYVSVLAKVKVSSARIRTKLIHSPLFFGQHGLDYSPGGSATDFMLDPTLFGILSQIEHDDIVLPAMQRLFVWKEDRIYRLIDSLLRGFPIGAVMLWKTTTIHRFRRLPRDVDADGPEIFNFAVSREAGSKYLVLDGQQRLSKAATATRRCISMF